MGCLNAWLSVLVDEDVFAAREVFISYWQREELDLLSFTGPEKSGAGRLIKRLDAVSLPSTLEFTVQYSPEQITGMRHRGENTDKEFPKYGPSLVLRYVLAMEKFMQEDREQHEVEQTLEDEDMANEAQKEVHAPRRGCAELCTVG